jgi:hypothetical protein
MNSLTAVDVYKIVNDINSQMFGTKEIAVIDTTSFVSVGEKILRSGTENIMDAMAVTFMNNYFPNTPYIGKVRIIDETAERWGAITLETVPLHMDEEASEDTNTNLNTNQFNDGNSVDMYKIKKPKVVQLKFYGTKKEQNHITRLDDQLSQAFRSVEEFSNFYTSVMTEFRNDIEQTMEAGRRLAICNYIAGLSAMGLYKIDLTKEYNTEHETTYTGLQLRTTYAKDFVPWFVAYVQNLSDCMTERSTMYHANFTDQNILRFTPKEYQKFIMLNSFWKQAQTSVLSAAFNDKYLKIADVEFVNYWQSIKYPEQIKIKPNILDLATGESKNATNNVELPYVLGCIFDRRAVGVNYQFTKTITTPVNAAGDYYNTYVHYRKNYWNNYTHNGVVFVMGEGADGKVI